MFTKINLNNNKTEANDYQMEINIKTLQIISRYTIITIIEYTQLTGFFLNILGRMHKLPWAPYYARNVKKK